MEFDRFIQTTEQILEGIILTPRMNPERANLQMPMSVIIYWLLFNYSVIIVITRILLFFDAKIVIRLLRQNGRSLREIVNNFI